jgi:hypothetical protein
MLTNLSEFPENLLHNGTKHEEGLSGCNKPSSWQVFWPNFIESSDHELNKVARALTQQTAELCAHWVSDPQIRQHFIMYGTLVLQTIQNMGLYASVHSDFIAKPVLLSLCTWKKQAIVFNSNSVALAKDLRQNSAKTGMQS